MRGGFIVEASLMTYGWHPEFISASKAAMLGKPTFKYVPFHDLSKPDQNLVRRAWSLRPSKSEYSILPEHHYFPTDRNRNVSLTAPKVPAIPYHLISDPTFMSSLGYVRDRRASIMNKVATVLRLAEALRS